MQVLFRGPQAREWQRDLYGPLSQWLGLEGETRYEVNNSRQPLRSGLAGA
jgi:hypothetical protein